MINAKKLRGQMYNMGYSQNRLAREIGVNKNTLSAKMNGKRDFDIGEVIRICQVLQINTQEEKCSIFLSESSQ